MSEKEIDGFKIDEFTLVQTCGACPEQYDVFNSDGEYVAYFRLRHGYFRASTASQKTTLYEAYPEGDGAFEFDERMKYLTEAIQAVRLAS